jgi:hypothetical protein
LVSLQSAQCELGTVPTEEWGSVREVENYRRLLEVFRRNYSSRP